ncbi:HAMP domain-containing protein [Rhodovastum atsumiense]|uniref:HAMP domain-containing protein n=1 Tax=Rhodovastum atsumiense TaxID=504468 RepID=A0A5M6IKP7_9PROT|nr:methyl-accepting chemotaxis protein [Rhodovastum atsumiense]KAA5608235.1 HAMP domain-containing protein [Rhodovastum atsumiense]CAH2602612.1 HAMP domain-containing protein [Rhodovastum atsumiense]
MSSIFANMKIASRLMIGFGILIAIVAGLSALATHSSSRSRLLVDEVERFNGQVIQNQAAEILMLQGRLAVWKALATNDPAAWTEVGTSIRKAQDSYTRLQGSTHDPARRAAVQALNAEVTSYLGTLTPLRQLGGRNEMLETPAGQASIQATNRIGQTITDMSEPLSEKYHAAAAAVSNEADATLQSAITQALAIGCAAVVIGIVLAIFVAHGITRPITGLTEAMKALAGKDLTTRIPAADQRDEVGEMARAVQVFKESMIRTAELVAAQEAERGTKERRQSAMDRHTQDFGTSVSGVMAALSRSGDSMRVAAEKMTESSRNVNTEASGTAEGASRTAQQLTSVAAAIEELTSSVAEISRQVTSASQVAQEAVKRADASQATMRGLSEATGRIGDVVQLINNIAGQTNLLALNATIEAARAGDAGRGFAVVANEVKKLAEQTSRATAEIGGQIEAVSGAAGNSVTAMADIAQIIGRLNEISGHIAAAVEQQSATTREIAGNLQLVSAEGSHASTAMQKVVDMSGEAGTMSLQVLDAARGIGTEADRLRTEVDQFLSAVRDETGNRRRYERIPGGGATATLSAEGRTASAPVFDLSRGGVALHCDWQFPAGTNVTVSFPGAGGPIGARVVRGDGRTLALVFRQDPEALARIDRMLAQIGGARQAA